MFLEVKLLHIRRIYEAFTANGKGHKTTKTLHSREIADDKLYTWLSIDSSKFTDKWNILIASGITKAWPSRHYKTHTIRSPTDPGSYI